MPALGCLPNPLDQAVEDNEEMVYKRVRDDGVSKRDKLRVESRRARLAAIPSRTVIDGTLTMQIKGRATASSHRSLTQRGEASIEAQHHDARSVGQAENASQNSRSPSQKIFKRTSISTKSTLGNLYPPLSPSNTSSNSKLGVHVIAPTDIGPRSSTPSQQLKSAVPSPSAVTTSSAAKTNVDQLYYGQDTQQPQVDMGSILSAATVHMLDPFDDDADDDAMRRLCRSPVLFPDNSISARLRETEGKLAHQTEIMDTVNFSEAKSRCDANPHASALLVDVGDEEEAPASVAGYRVALCEDLDGPEYSSRPNQQVNRSLGAPGNSAGPAITLGFASQHVSEKGSVDSVASQVHTPRHVRRDVQPSSSVIRPSVPSSSHSTPSGKARLVDHIALLESSLNEFSTRSSPVHHLPIHVSSREARSATTAAHGPVSSAAAPENRSKLDDYIAELEAALKGSKIPSFTASVSKSDTPGDAGDSKQVSLQNHLQKAPVMRAEDFYDSKGLQNASPAAQNDENQFIAGRRRSSASSESYEPASPARSATPEFQDFAPGEFVISPEELVASSIDAPPLQYAQGSQAAITPKKEKMAELHERPADVPMLSARELPPNMPVPAMDGRYGSSSGFSPLQQTTRVQPPPPHLRHPQPKRGTSTPTAYALEESAAARSAHMIEMTVEYEEEPVDIAARNIKPPKEYISKVKFAETEAVAERDESPHPTNPSEASPEGSAIGTHAHIESISTTKSKSEEPEARFEFTETDILKGLSMPSLARGRSDSPSETTESESQPESPDDITGILPSFSKMQLANTSGVRAPIQVVNLATSSSPSRPESAASSRSTSSVERSKDAEQSDSEDERCASSAASRMMAPAIRVGGSLQKKEGMKAGFAPQRSFNRYGMHSGYTGPKRSFRTFEYPSHIAPDAGWGGSDGVVHGTTAVHPQTAYDIAQEQGGHAALASFLENYQTPLTIAGSSNLAFMEELIPETDAEQRGKRHGHKEQMTTQVNDRSELDIFDDLLL